MTVETMSHNLPDCKLSVEEYPYFLTCVRLLDMMSLKKVKKVRQAELIALYQYYRSKQTLADYLDVLDHKVEVHPKKNNIIGCQEAIRKYALRHFGQPTSANIF